MSRSSKIRHLVKARKFGGDAIIITALIALFGYVALGFGPFGADGYSMKGEPMTVQHYGSSSDYRFINY